MKKCQGLLNHLLYSKKKIIHQSRSLDNSTNNKIATIINYNTKVSKSKPKISLNKTQDINLPNNPVIEKAKCLPPQNYPSQFNIKSQNHSFTTAIPSEKIYLNASSQKNTQINRNLNTSTNLNQQNQNFKPMPIAQIQSGSKYSNITYYNKMKQKMSSNIMHDKSSANVSFYQYHKDLFSNLKLQKDKKNTPYLNKSISTYEEEWCDKETHSNANLSLSQLNKLKIIEGELEEGLNELNKQNEGNLIANAKSYNLYKVALEEVLKELPQDYYEIIKKIVNGYHQIILTFVSEQKKIIDNYDDLQTKYSSISKELIAIKSSNNIDYNEIHIEKSQDQCDENIINDNNDNNKTIPQSQVQRQTYTKQNHHNTHTKAQNNTYLFSLLNSKPEQNKKQESHPNAKECKGYINSTHGDKKKSSQMENKKDFEDLETLYFSDKVLNGTNSSIGMTINVPKLPLNFLG